MAAGLVEVLELLQSGVSDAIQDLEQYQSEDSSPTLDRSTQELKSGAEFLQQIAGWVPTMPADRLREILKACIESIRKSFVALLESGEVETLEQEDGEGDGIPGFLIEAMERLGPTLFVREDKMQASIQVDKEEAPMWTPPRIEKFLENEEIVHGIDTRAIEKIFEKRQFDQPVVIARGTKPVPGTNGYVKYTFDMEQISGRPKELDSGRVDHKELSLFVFVAPGHVLADLIPPKQGVAGTTIYGEEIPTEDGCPAELVAGENTALSEDGSKLLSQAEGYISVEGNLVSVKPSMLIAGDVSYETGNINSPIGVTVQGNILSGFRVHSKDSVNVAGLVEAAQIVSELDIAINGGVEGKGKGTLQAHGEIRVQFLNDVKVSCGGSLYSAGSIYHSRVQSNESVLAEGAHGHIAEGIVRAEDSIEAEQIGSEMGVKTRIELGFATLALPGRIEELRDRVEELTEKLKRLAAAAEKLKRLKKSRGSLDPQREKGLKQAIAAVKKYKQLVQSKQEEADELEEAHAAGLRKMRFVKARKQIWPGTTIRILETEYDVKNPTGPATVTLIDDEIHVLPYTESDIPTPAESSSGG